MRRHWKLLAYSAAFVLPLLITFALDGFCFGGRGCGEGLYAALFLYGAGLILCIVAFTLARIFFSALKVTPPIRRRVIKLIALLPLLPALIIIGILLFGLGRLAYEGVLMLLPG